MTYPKSNILLALTTLVAAYGCTSTKATTLPPAVPPAATSTDSSASFVNPKPDDDATRGTLKIAQDIRVACGLADDEAHFAFDSARVVDTDKRMLRTLSDCFVSGPLKGREMRLVGHADPRGPEDYNLVLAGKRADNVKGIMVAETMNEGRVSTTSRGEMDATGTDEMSWANDRRVDMYLGK